MFTGKIKEMKNILIPTDFTVESLQLVEYATLNHPESMLNITLVAGFHLPQSFWGIAHYSEREQVNNQLSEEFNAFRRRLVIEHKSTINNITIKLFTGVTAYAFKNFLEQLEVKDAVVPKDGFLYNSSRSWFDTTVFLRKTVSHVVEVAMERAQKVSERNILVKKPVQAIGFTK